MGMYDHALYVRMYVCSFLILELENFLTVNFESTDSKYSLSLHKLGYTLHYKKY